jgi:Ca-activated chloride channel family protein
MMMKFLQPEMAIWFLMLPFIILLWVLHVRAKHQFRSNAGFGASLRSLSSFSTDNGDRSLLLAALIATSALVLSMMKPQLYIDRLLPEFENKDLVLVLDRSVSMYARDVPPSRFARAIEEIRVFLSEKPDEIDRVGLVGFAGTSITLSHLTRDLDTLFFFLDWIREDPNVYFGTDLAGALTSALEVTRKDGKPTRKIFLLLSDGDDQGEKLPALLNELRGEDIRVHSIGIGTDSAVPIPTTLEVDIQEYLVNDEGEQLMTQLDETTLRMIASMTGGSFFRSTTGHELADFMKQILNQERRQVGWKRSVDYQDFHVPLLMLAVISSFFLVVRV